VEPERVPPQEFIEVWQSSNSVAEVAKKTGMLKKTVRVRACRYRKLGIRLKDFPPVELPDWDELAEYARSLLPEGAVSTGVGSDEDEEDLEDPSGIEEEEPEPASVVEPEGSPAPVGEAEAEPVARADVHIGDAPSASEPSSETKASGGSQVTLVFRRPARSPPPWRLCRRIDPPPVTNRHHPTKTPSVRMTDAKRSRS